MDDMWKDGWVEWPAIWGMEPIGASSLEAIVPPKEASESLC